MATRGERFKAAAERSGPKREPGGAKNGAKTKAGARPGGTGAGTGERSARSKSIVSAEGPESARRYGGMSTAARNRAKGYEGRGKAGKGIYVLEDSRATSPPSRKSTRRSKAHVKGATQLTTRTEMRVSSPSRRHATRT